MRLKFKDNEVLEGMMPNDLSLTTAEGFLINPPDLRSNTQRIFVPRTALESLDRAGRNRRHPPPPQGPRQTPGKCNCLESSA